MNVFVKTFTQKFERKRKGQSNNQEEKYTHKNTLIDLSLNFSQWSNVEYISFEIITCN